MTFGLKDSNEYNDLDELINLIDDNLYRGKKKVVTELFLIL